MEKFSKHKKILIGLLNGSIVASLGVLFMFYSPASSLRGANPNDIFSNEVNALSRVHHKPSPSATAPSMAADRPDSPSSQPAEPTTLGASSSADAGTSNPAATTITATHGAATNVAAAHTSYASVNPTQNRPAAIAPVVPVSPVSVPGPTGQNGTIQQVTQAVYQIPVTVNTTLSRVVRSVPLLHLGL